MKYWWHRVLDYRYDPILTFDSRKPLPPDILPWLFPTSRVWLAALWIALWNKNDYLVTHNLENITFH